VLKKLSLSILATIFAAATILYCVLFIYSTSWQSPVELGFDDQYVESRHCELVKGVQKDSPAEKAGLRVGDRILGSTAAALRTPTRSTKLGPGVSLEILSS